MYKLLYSSLAVKDAKKISKSNLQDRCTVLLSIIAINPYQNPPPYEKLCDDLSRYISRRINIQDRIIYEIDEKAKIVKILRIWGHYE